MYGCSPVYPLLKMDWTDLEAFETEAMDTVSQNRELKKKKKEIKTSSIFSFRYRIKLE